MNGADVDRISRLLRLGSSRRRAFAALTLGVLSIRTRAASGKKSGRSPKANAFGCLNVGQRCRGNDTLCCSGICEGMQPKHGKKDKSRCAAHDTGGCLAAQGEAFRTDSGETAACTTATGQTGVCGKTTGNAGFCAATIACADCRKDADCRDTFGSRAACVVCAECNGTACVGQGD